MTSVFNVISKGKMLARLYFSVNPSYELFVATLLYYDCHFITLSSKKQNEVQEGVIDILNSKYGASKYEIVPSEPVELEEYEGKFYKFMSNIKKS